MHLDTVAEGVGRRIVNLIEIAEADGSTGAATVQYATSNGSATVYGYTLSSSSASAAR